jgi:hypothetical protein
MTNNCNGLSHLFFTPVKFGHFNTVTLLDGHASTITSFCATHNKFCAIVGLSTLLAVATLHPPSCHNPYHSASNLHAINMTLVTPSSGNLQHARRSSKMAKISSITSAPLAIVLKYMATSAILFAFGTVTQLHISGSSKHQSLLNFVQFAPFRWSLLSSSLTTMADASNHSQPPSNQLAGVCPQLTLPSQPMATLSQAHAISSLPSILCAHQRSNRFTSNHPHHLSHALLAYQFGSHSINQNILCC